jgi:flavin reductase (DIM6/NTAB) family NADH-FMN oxidoreductase RutF
MQPFDSMTGPIDRITTESFRRACAKFATGVAVVTTLAPNGEPHGLTINSFCSLSLDPPLVMIAIARDCVFLQHFESSGHFAVNILSEHQRDLSNRFAQLPEGRFAGVAWRSAATGSPLIEGSLAVLECNTTQALDAGDHRVLIGEAVAFEIGEGSPLIFFASDYARLIQPAAPSTECVGRQQPRSDE